MNGREQKPAKQTPFPVADATEVDLAGKARIRTGVRAGPDGAVGELAGAVGEQK